MMTRYLLLDDPIMVNKNHCCDMMVYQVSYKCPKHEDPFDCPDNLIFYNAQFDEYGIILHSTVFDEDGNIIHEGVHVYEVINCCPWCGEKLPESKRERWFEELEKIGVVDPWNEDIPKKYKTDAWYRPG